MRFNALYTSTKCMPTIMNASTFSVFDEIQYMLIGLGILSTFFFHYGDDPHDVRSVDTRDS